MMGQQLLFYGVVRDEQISWDLERERCLGGEEYAICLAGSPYHSP